MKTRAMHGVYQMTRKGLLKIFGGAQQAGEGDAAGGAQQQPHLHVEFENGVLPADIAANHDDFDAKRQRKRKTDEH